MPRVPSAHWLRSRGLPEDLAGLETTDPRWREAVRKLAPPAKSRGVGDTVAKVIHAVTGLTPCQGCNERRDALNRAFPYKQ